MAISGGVSLQLLDGDAVVGVNADFAGDLHRFFGDFAGAEAGVLNERGGGGLGKCSAGADGSDRIVGIDDVSRAGDEKSLPLVGDDEQSLEVAQHLVGAPVLG